MSNPKIHNAVLPARANLVLAIVLTSYLMIVLDISIVITGLPKIRDELGFSPVTLSWVQTAYTLCFGGFLLLAARAGDMLGRRRMFRLGLGIFTGASLAIAAAPTAWVLLAARAVQGVGAAILAPSVLALISTNFAEGEARTRALATYSMVAGFGSSLGLVLGGLFADLLSWRAGFFMNVPIGVVLFIAAGRVLQESEAHEGRFDMMGAVSSTLGMGALVYGIIRSADHGWIDLMTLAAVTAGLALLALFALHEARATQPIMPLRLFASAERSGAYAARMLFLGAMVGFFFFSTQLMQVVRGFTAMQAGLGFLPMTLPTLAAAMMVPAFTRRLGNSGLVMLALALGAVGMFWLAWTGAEASYMTGIALPMLLIGFGNGFALGPLTVAGVAGVAARDAGAASGVVNVAHQLGGTLGLSILVVAFAAAGGADGATSQAYAHGITVALAGGGLMLLAGLVTAAIFIRTRRPAAATRSPNTER